MVTWAWVRDMDPGLYHHCARQWRVQADGLDDFTRLVHKQVLDRLEDWSGPAARLGKRRITDQVGEAFGDAPGRARSLSTAYDRAGEGFGAAHRLAVEAEAEASEHGYRISDDGVVYVPGSVLPLGADLGRERMFTHRPIEPHGGTIQPIQAKADRAMRLAERTEAELARTIPVIIEGLPWAADDPNVLSPDEAAELLDQAVAGDQAAWDRLRRHQAQFADPWFAKELVVALGPDGLTGLPGAMTDRMHQIVLGRLDDDPAQVTRNNRELLRMLSDALAAATDPGKGAWEHEPRGLDSFLEGLRTAGRGQHPTAAGSYDGYWGLGQIMQAAEAPPVYSERFLGEVGVDMIAWDREQNRQDPRWPEYAGPADRAAAGLLNQPGTHPDRAGTGTDPLAGLMHAAGSNADGAQILLATGDDDANLRYLLGERQWPADHGSGLGEAVEAAATGQDAAAKRLAAHAFDLYADHAREHITSNGRELNLTGDHDALSGMREKLANVAVAHIDDLNQSVLMPRQDPDGGYVADLDEEGKQAWVGARDLAYVLTDITQDDAAYARLVNGQIGYLGAAMEDHARAGDGEEAVESAKGSAKVLGFLTDAHANALTAAGRESDASHNLVAEAVRKGAGFIPAPPIPGGNLLAAGYGPAADWVASRLESQHELEAFREVTDDQSARVELVNQATARVLIEHELYGGDPPDRSSLFMDGDRFKPLHEIYEDRDTMAALHTWAYQEANRLFAAKLDTDVQHTQGGTTYAREMGLPDE